MHNRHARHLTITRIGRTLTVGAVAGDSTVHIIQLATLPDLVYLVDKVVRGADLARGLDIGINGVSLNLLGRKIVDTRNLNLREYEPRETCMV